MTYDDSGAKGVVPNIIIRYFNENHLGGVTYPISYPGPYTGIYGAQYYSGSEQNPVFAPGVYANQFDGATRDYGTLTITAVPEPAAWSMMLTGFGLLGAALRAPRRALAKA